MGKIIENKKDLSTMVVVVVKSVSELMVNLVSEDFPKDRHIPMASREGSRDNLSRTRTAACSGSDTHMWRMYKKLLRMLSVPCRELMWWENRICQKKTNVLGHNTAKCTRGCLQYIKNINKNQPSLTGEKFYCSIRCGTAS